MALTVEQLEEGRRIAALVVKHCGDRYRPIFNCFDRELSRRVDADDRLNLVLRSQVPINRIKRRRRLRADCGS